jgi:hypothetical protein
MAEIWVFTNGRSLMQRFENLGESDNADPLWREIAEVLAEAIEGDAIEEREETARLDGLVWGPAPERGA